MNKIKRQYIMALVFSLLFCVTVFGHSGRTDQNGGHYNRKTGGYHTHNGGGVFPCVVLIGGIAVYLIYKLSGNKK